MLLQANEKLFYRNGEVIVKKDLPREVIEAKLKLAKTELESAGFIHSRDLRKHIRRLERTLKSVKQSDRFPSRLSRLSDNSQI